MIRRLSLASRLALLFAACTAVVSLIAGVLFNHASETHFIELDQQLLESKLPSLREALHGVSSREQLTEREPQLKAAMAHQPDLTLSISGPDATSWFDSARVASAPSAFRPGLQTLIDSQAAYRSYTAALQPGSPDSPQLTLLLDITHHQHFLQRMQHLIWLTVGLSALARYSMSLTICAMPCNSSRLLSSASR